VSKTSKTAAALDVAEQITAHGIEFGDRMRDEASGFEGHVCALYLYEHGCMRVQLRGANKTTGEPVDATFDAPELEHATTGEPVARSRRTGGPHGLSGPALR